MLCLLSCCPADEHEGVQAMSACVQPLPGLLQIKQRSPLSELA